MTSRGRAGRREHVGLDLGESRVESARRWRWRSAAVEAAHGIVEGLDLAAGERAGNHENRERGSINKGSLHEAPAQAMP